MTIGKIPVNNDNAAISAAPTAKGPISSRPTAFPELLKPTASLSGGSADLDAIFEIAGQRYNVSPSLLKAVAKAESNFRTNAISSSGAIGIMQLMPGTAAGLGVTDAFDPEQNIMGGSKYLRQMLDRFCGDLELALGAYNAGPGAVSKYSGVPPYSRNYVSKVLGLFRGDDITAGLATYGGYSGRGQGGNASGAPFGSLACREALSQMVLIKVIEMQMNTKTRTYP